MKLKNLRLRKDVLEDCVLGPLRGHLDPERGWVAEWRQDLGLIELSRPTEPRYADKGYVYITPNIVASFQSKSKLPVGNRVEHKMNAAPIADYEKKQPKKR